MKKVISDGVVPIMSDNSSWETFSSIRMLCGSFLGQLQQRLIQPLLVVHRHKIGDDLVLVRNAHGQIAQETLSQGVAAQARQELITRDLFYHRLFHRGGCFPAWA